MEQKISISKAARLLGVKRSELNQRLRAADIETFEGEVSFKKVKCIAPTLNFPDPATERLTLIRENPAKRVEEHETVLSRQELLDEMSRLSSELRVETLTARNYRQIIEDVAGKLGQMQVSGNQEERELAFELCHWLRERIIKD